MHPVCSEPRLRDWLIFRRMDGRDGRTLSRIPYGAGLGIATSFASLLGRPATRSTPVLVLHGTANWRLDPKQSLRGLLGKHRRFVIINELELGRPDHPFRKQIWEHPRLDTLLRGYTPQISWPAAERSWPETSRKSTRKLLPSRLG